MFLLLHLVPGDPVELMLGDWARPADRAALRHALGLERSVAAQLVDWFSGLARLDLGTSLFSRRPVVEVLLERLPATLELTVAALGLALLIALPLGVLAARHKGRPVDSGAMSFSLLGVSMPNFWLGPC